MPFNTGSDRVTIQDSPDELNILIPAKFNLNLCIMLAVGFVLIYIQGRWIISDLRGDEISYLDLIPTVLWLAALYWIVRAVLWSVRGREKISLNESSLKIRFEMPGISRTFTFNISDVEGLRTFAPSAPSGSRPLGLFIMFPDHRGRIVFDYKKKIHAFGVDLTEKDASRVIQRMEEFRSRIAQRLG